MEDEVLKEEESKAPVEHELLKKVKKFLEERPLAEARIQAIIDERNDQNRQATEFNRKMIEDLTKSSCDPER